MKLHRTLSLLVLGIAATGFVAAQGCSSSESETPGGTTTSTNRTPPKPPSGASASDTPARTFAVNRLFLGETDRNGTNGKEAWKEYGYDIDGLKSTKESKDVCQRQGGADPAKQEDGTDGIDNAFGRTIIGYLTGILPTPSKTVSESITDGSFTIMLDIKGLTDEPKQTNTGLSGRLLVGGSFADEHKAKPTFAPTDDWPYRKEPIVPIEGAYINNGTFVNGAAGATVELSIFIQDVALSLTINRAAITFEHQPPNDITNGTISGVLGTEALITGIEKVAGRLSPQLCEGSLVETIKQTIRGASDILADGSNKPGVPCDAISVGIGFTAKRVGNPKTLAKDSTPEADPCAKPQGDGGT